MNMTNDIKFSIIVPAYNSQDYIKNAIESVLNQSYKNIELIIVNDGSTDGTAEIVGYYAKKDRRIIFLSKKNGGYTSAVNFGLDYVSGDYFVLLGSDDYLNELLFETIINNINNIQPDIIVFKSIQKKGDVSNNDVYSNFNTTRLVSDSLFFENIKNAQDGVGLLCNRDTSKAFRTEILNGQRYYGKTGVDSDDVFSMRFSRRSSSFLFLPIIGYYWTIRPESITGRKPSQSLISDTVRVYENYFTNLSNNAKLNSFELDYLVSYYYKIIRYMKTPTFVIKNYLLIKKVYLHTLFWLNKNAHVKLKHKLPYYFPLIYCFVSKIID